MDTARIAALLEPFLEQSLTQSQLDQISIYIDLLKRWNARINLTAIRNEEEIVTRHFGESLFMARHLFPNVSSDSESVPGLERAPSRLRLDGDVRVPDLRVLDIGSGAGFPALPLKIWAPSIDLTMVESNHKKAVFLREVARLLTLTNINVIAERAEALSQRVGKDFPPFDIVTLRAVERFETILPLAATFLAPQASLAVLIGTAQAPELDVLTTLKWNHPTHVPKSLSRVLSIGQHSDGSGK
jgi:16S rRNA (guanine527-N7)-methyltransferase